MKGLAAAMVEVFLDLRSMRALCPSVADVQNCPAPKVLRSVAIRVSRIVELRGAFPRRSLAPGMMVHTGGEGQSKHRHSPLIYDRWTAMNLI